MRRARNYVELEGITSVFGVVVSCCVMLWPSAIYVIYVRLRSCAGSMHVLMCL